MDFPLQNIDQGNNHTYISNNVKQRVSLKTLQELEQAKKITNIDHKF
jgi:hypothetical protein